MADNHSPEVRSYNMSRIRSKDTRPEEIVRKYLFSRGLRYRKNDKRFHGKPDIVIPKHKTVIFIHGCFWHCHDKCPDYVQPKSNQKYWKVKLERNKHRDAEHILALKTDGWHVITVWECELKKNVCNNKLEHLYAEITANWSTLNNMCNKNYHDKKSKNPLKILQRKDDVIRNNCKKHTKNRK